MAGSNLHLLGTGTLLINRRSASWRALILLTLLHLASVVGLKADLVMSGGVISTGRNAATATLLQNGKVLLTGGYNLNAGGPVVNAELYDPAMNNWTPVHAMGTGRYLHTATLLPNGKVLVAGGYGISGTLSSAELYDPGTDSWTPTPIMPSARENHTATLLPNAKVLLVGGRLGDPVLATAALYDSANNSWAAALPMGAARVGHTATLLPNGKALVAGGWNGSYLNTAQLYDYTTGNWTSTPNPMTGTRYLHSAALLPNGNVLVSGGWNGNIYLNSAEIYNPTAGTWTLTTSMSFARFAHTSTPMANGKVLIAAGYGPPSGEHNSLEVYDYVMGWSSAGSIPTARQGHTATVLGDGRVLIAAGYNNTLPFAMDATLYVPSVSTWKLTQQMSVPREFHSANLLPDGKVLIAGGWSSSGPTASAELYNHTTGLWESTVAMPSPRYSHTATTLPYFGWTLVTGGYDNNGLLLSSTVIYKPYKPLPATAASWTPAHPMTYARYLHTATLLPYIGYNKVLVTGGCGTGGVVLSNAEIFDLTMDSWFPAGSGAMSVPRYSHTATWMPGGKVLIAGGSSASVTLSTAELYDSSGGSWSSAPQMPSARRAHSATLLANGKILIAGGLGSDSAVLSTAVVYDPAGSGSWMQTAPMVTARYCHTATLLPEGKVLVTGGLCGGNTPCAELYDPAGTGSWTPTGSLNNGRYDHTATALPKGKVLVAGGAPASYSPIASAEIYGSLLVDPKNSGGRTVTPVYYASTGTQYFPQYVNVPAGSAYSIGRRLNLSAFISSLPSTGWGFNSDNVPINGLLRVPSGAGPFPLVIFAHGNHTPPIDRSEEGYNYLCDLLASWGILAASIDANFLNGGECTAGVTCLDMQPRAILHLEHVRQFKIWNETPNHPLCGKVDLNKIMIVGHSRGGEAAAHASYFNTLSGIAPAPGQNQVPFDGSAGLGPYGFTFKAVVGIAPTDRFNPLNVQTKVKNNYFVIQASRDGDIYAFEGYGSYDRAHPIDLNDPTHDAAGFKAVLYCVGGNHNYFHQTWDPEVSNMSLLLSRSEQQQITKVFIGALTQATLLGQSEYLELLKNPGLAKDWLPAGKDVISQYQDPKRLFINHYEEDQNPGIPSPPVSGQNNWSAYSFQEMSFDSTWKDLHQQTRGVRLNWRTPGANYQMSFFPPGLSAAPYAYLALRIGQSAEPDNFAGVDQNFRIYVQDSAGASADFHAAPFSRVLYPDFNPYYQVGGCYKIVMQTIRIPLNLFRSRGLNVNSISAINLSFDQLNSGTVYFDEIQLSN